MSLGLAENKKAAGRRHSIKNDCTGRKEARNRVKKILFDFN
jgi:hypothetical protein